MIFGFTIEEWGTIVIIVSTIIGFLNNVLKNNVKIPLDKVRAEISDLRQQEAEKHEEINERVSRVEGRVNVLEKQKGA